MKKLLFIVNPHAGKGLIKNQLLGIVDILVKADYEVTLYITQGPQDAIRKVKERDRSYDLVVCSGGDGTLDEVVTGMKQSGFTTTIGYIPAGSTNDFANSLEIPSDMKAAASIIAAGKEFSCDIGTFNEDVFVYIAAFGIFTEVSYGTPQELKNMLGHMAYILEGVKQIQNIQSYHLKFTYQKETEEVVIEDEFIYGMITNSRSVGGMKKITGPNVDLNDGLFEVTLIKRPANMIELNKILAALVSENYDTDLIYTFKTDRLRAESEEEVAWTLDGEFGGRHTDLLLKNCKKAMRIMVSEDF